MTITDSLASFAPVLADYLTDLGHATVDLEVEYRVLSAPGAKCLRDATLSLFRYVKGEVDTVDDARNYLFWAIRAYRAKFLKLRLGQIGDLIEKMMEYTNNGGVLSHAQYEVIQEANAERSQLSAQLLALPSWDDESLVLKFFREANHRTNHLLVKLDDICLEAKFAGPGKG